MKATEVTTGLAESNGSLLPGLWRDSLHVTCGLTACTPGSAPGATLGNEYGKTLLYLYFSDRGTRLRTTCPQSLVTQPRTLAGNRTREFLILSRRATSSAITHHYFCLTGALKCYWPSSSLKVFRCNYVFFLKPFWKCYKVFMNKKFIYTTANDLEQDNMTLKYWLTNTYPHGKDVRRTIHCDILNH